MTSPSSRGRAGEQRVADFLEQKGYNILDRNFRLSLCEVDIIGEKDRVLHFCEVKTWRSMPFEATEQSLSRQKRQRIQMCAAEFLRRRPELDGYGVMFDLVFVDSSSGDIRHIEDAWTPSDDT